MLHTLSEQDSPPFADFDGEPTAAELAAIEQEMPAILADVARLDVRISLMDRQPTEVDARRTRRATRRLLTERARLAAARPVAGVPA